MTHIERLQVTSELLVAVAQRLEVLVNLRDLPIYTEDGEDYLGLLANYLEVCCRNAAQCEVVPANFIELVEEARTHCARASIHQGGWANAQSWKARLVLAAESAHRAAVVANRTVSASRAGRAA